MSKSSAPAAPSTVGMNDKVVNLINELYRSFHFFNNYFCKNELSEPLITIQGDKRRTTYGWFGKEFWEETIDGKKTKKINEINLTAESLFRGHNEVLGTLLHEMAHLKNAQNNIFDCTKTQYHNDKFKKSAEEFGLIVDRMKGRGWAKTTLGNKAKDAINLLDPKKDVYKIVRNPPEIEKPEPKTITLLVNISYQEKIEELLGHYGKKREMTEAAIDALYKQKIK
jgi:hypothetical protein